MQLVLVHCLVFVFFVVLQFWLFRSVAGEWLAWELFMEPRRNQVTRINYSEPVFFFFCLVGVFSMFSSELLYCIPQRSLDTPLGMNILERFSSTNFTHTRICGASAIPHPPSKLREPFQQ